jgi:signal transduction histidine kinase
MWELVGGLNLLIAACYVAIATLILRGLVRTHQVRSNALALATSFIFISCALHHGSHAFHLLLPSSDIHMQMAVREMFDSWPSVVIDLFGATVAGIYLALRGSYKRLLQSPSMFGDATESVYRQIVENLPQTAIMVLGKDLRYLIAEGAAFAGSEERRPVIGESPENFLSAEQLPVSMAHYRAALRGEINDYESRTGGAVYRIRTVPMRDEDDAIIGVLLIADDVTTAANAKTDVEAARDVALEATLMQKNFAASASHELKTPIAAIVGFAEELLQSDELTEDDRGYVTIIARNAHRLSRLTEDLLILGEAEIGESMMRMQPVALAPVVSHVVESFTAIARSQSIELRWPGTDLTAFADGFRLEQVLTNLISNAVKFTPAGGTVTITADASPDEVTIAVVDTGIGIAPDSLTRIFDRFYRTKEVVDGGIKGTGLGLSIAKRMIEAQQGTLTATSTPGRGSVFTVTLARVKEASAR